MIDQLRKVRDNVTVYDAGLPRFPRNFTRDGVIAALLFDDADMMRGQLEFCARHQGTKYDMKTGEEPGKVHHEWPGYPIRDHLTTYNACDSAAFFLIGHEYLVRTTGNRRHVDMHLDQIRLAATYIQAHLNSDNLFEESPRHCGAEQFALKVTYWKDSVILDRHDGEPAWPAVFTLAHIQNLCGLRCAARLLASAELHTITNRMRDALPLLWDSQRGTFYTAIDQQGPISAVTSDSLHALYYLEPDDLSAEQVASIERSSEALESSIGYFVMTPEDAKHMDRIYHATTVWPFEQGLIHAGAGRFGLGRVQRVCERIQRAIQDDAPELVAINVHEPEISSNPQLWTLAAQHYFSR